MKTGRYKNICIKWHVTTNMIWHFLKTWKESSQ